MTNVILLKIRSYKWLLVIKNNPVDSLQAASLQSVYMWKPVLVQVPCQSYHVSHEGSLVLYSTSNDQAHATPFWIRWQKLDLQSVCKSTERLIWIRSLVVHHIPDRLLVPVCNLNPNKNLDLVKQPGVRMNWYMNEILCLYLVMEYRAWEGTKMNFYQHQSHSCIM